LPLPALIWLPRGKPEPTSGRLSPGAPGADRAGMGRRRFPAQATTGRQSATGELADKVAATYNDPSKSYDPGAWTPDGARARRGGAS
jgi:hypothetical protein